MSKVTTQHLIKTLTNLNNPKHETDAARRTNAMNKLCENVFYKANHEIEHIGIKSFDTNKYVQAVESNINFSQKTDLLDMVGLQPQESINDAFTYFLIWRKSGMHSDRTNLQLISKQSQLNPKDMRDFEEDFIKQLEKHASDFDVSDGGHFTTLINFASNKIAQDTRRGPGNIVLANKKSLEILLQDNKDYENPKTVLNLNELGDKITYVGILNESIKVYHNPYCKSNLPEAYVMYRGSDTDCGLYLNLYSSCLPDNYAKGEDTNFNTGMYNFLPHEQVGSYIKKMIFDVNVIRTDAEVDDVTTNTPTLNMTELYELYIPKIIESKEQHKDFVESQSEKIGTELAHYKKELELLKGDPNYKIANYEDTKIENTKEDLVDYIYALEDLLKDLNRQSKVDLELAHLKHEFKKFVADPTYEIKLKLEE